MTLHILPASGEGTVLIVAVSTLALRSKSMNAVSYQTNRNRNDDKQGDMGDNLENTAALI